MMLHHAGTVIHPEEPLLNSDETMLLCLCSAGTRPSSDIVGSLRVLLKFGVNVNATDKYGNTATHLFLAGLSVTNEIEHAIKKDFLVLLLQSILRTGADLHVRNNFGIEASQVAYGHLDVDEEDFDYFPQRARLWSEALTELGFDVAEFQSCCSGCRCTNGNNLFETAVFCDSFEKRAYLSYITLGPIEAVDSSSDDEYADEEYADEEYADEENGDSEVELDTYPRRRNQNDIIIRCNSQELEDNHPQRKFEVIESDDENYEDAEEEFKPQFWTSSEDNFNGSSSYQPEREENVTPAPLEVIGPANERYSNSEPEPEHYHWPSSHNLISTSNQEPNSPATRSKTFWNVI